MENKIYFNTKYLVLLTLLAGIFLGCTPKNPDLTGVDKMDYLLETENGEIIDDFSDKRIIYEINRIANEDISPTEDYGFIILTPKDNINDIQYIQMAKNVGSNEYTIEIRIGDNKNFVHYQYTSTGKEEVTSIFLDFANNKKLPDLEKWADVSGQYR